MIKLKYYVNKLMTDSSVFVCIGANDGIFVEEMYHSNLINPKWKSFLLEPVYSTFAKLTSNYTRLFPDNNFTFINKAIHNYSGKGYLSTSLVDDSMAMCSFFRHNGPGSITVEVDCITFKDLISEYNIDHIDLLKIDTEGMDYEIVVQCLNNNINPKIILLECIPLLNTVSSYDNMLESIKEKYTIIKDVPEYQYEEANLLLINNQYV